MFFLICKCLIISFVLSALNPILSYSLHSCTYKNDKIVNYQSLLLLLLFVFCNYYYYCYYILLLFLLSFNECKCKN